MMRNILVYGASRGLGRAIVDSISQLDDQVFAIARSLPQVISNNTRWISSDLSQPSQSVADVGAIIKDTPIHALIYNVGLWEKGAFSDDYNFEHMTQEEILTMIQVNISSCLLHLQAMMSNLKKAHNAKVILIGSTWGLDNHNGKEIVFSASKHALRGIAQSLREILRQDKVGVSVLNLGYLATEETTEALIPLADVIAAIQFILNTSSATCVKGIDMPAMLDVNV